MELMQHRPTDRGFNTLRNQIDRLFNEFLGSSSGDGWSLFQKGWAPAIDVTEDDSTIIVKAELPGIPADAIEVTVTDNALTIQGEKLEEKEDQDQEGKTWMRKERFYGKFSRTIPLPEGIDAEKIEAVDRAGVVTITIPKTEVAKARKIEVKAATG